jgi:fructokinase
MLFASVAAERVVIGGGVAKTEGLLERIAARTAELSAGYLPGGPRHKVLAPQLGEDAGITGAMMLTEAAIRTR